MIFGKDDSSSSSDEAEEGEDLFGKKDGGGGGMIMMPQVNPQDKMFANSVDDMQSFFGKINDFEQITSQSLKDIWKVSGSAFQHIKVKLDLQEYIPGLFDLLRPAPRVPISKIMSVFCFLQIETYNLKHEIESRFFDPLILFGESGFVFEEEGDDKETAGDHELQISRSLKVFNEFLNVIRRIVDLSKNIVYQMNGLYQAKDKVYQNSFKKMIYFEIFDNFGEILTTLFIVDLIIQENTNFVAFWEDYTQMFLMAGTNPSKYRTTPKDLKKLMKFVQKIYQNILSGQLYDNYLDGLHKIILEETGKSFVFGNKTFKEKYLEYIKFQINKVDQKLSNPEDKEGPSSYMTLLINYSLYRKLFQDEDSKLYKKIWALQKACPIIILYNNLSVNPGTFLVRKCPLKKATKCDPPDLDKFLKMELAAKDEEYCLKLNLYYVKLVQWIVQMNSDVMVDVRIPEGSGTQNTEFLNERAKLITRGLNMATELKRNVKTLILMYQRCGKQPQKARLHDIVRTIEMIKAIEVQFRQKRFLINQWVTLICRYTSEIVDQIIVKGINQVGQWYTRGQFYEDMMFLLQTIYESHQGGHNFMRKTVIYHCLCLMTHQVFNPKELNEILGLCQRLEVISDWEKIVKKSTRCRFVYWIRSLYPFIFDMIMADVKRPNQINYFLMAMNDPIEMLWNVRHLEQPNICVDNYKKEVYRAFTEKVIKPICLQVEGEIRMQINQAIIPKLGQKNPLTSRTFDCYKYIHMSDVYLFEKCISMKEEVRHYLGRVFYQMSALSPHDFQTYEHMRVFAKEQLQMDLVPSHLPSQQLQQGIDIMQLLRELGKFVSKYNYNIHTQIFVETTQETRQIKTIGTNQMLYSIKTHGIGVMGTVINTFYKFLIKKLNIFNEFLFDEFIHNPLMQEQRFFRKNKEKCGHKYPYERAEALSKTIKRLGTNKQGVSYLDKFRQLITHIGNALGYVRMIRTAALKDNSNLVKYIPTMLEETRFEMQADDLDIKEETYEAMKMLDLCVRNIFKQADDAGDYLRLIVRNFDGMFDGDETKHLRLFYMMIPPLSLNYIEHLQAGKERINSKNKNVGGFISDDGFPLGIAYLLKILNQTDKFESINWFDSMIDKLERDQISAVQREKHMENEIGMHMGQNEDYQKLDAEMSKRRIKNLNREYQMLKFCYTSANILFKEI